MLQQTNHIGRILIKKPLLGLMCSTNVPDNGDFGNRDLMVSDWAALRYTEVAWLGVINRATCEYTTEAGLGERDGAS